MRSANATVALVSMPWGPVGEPSLGLALLKSALRSSEISARVFHLAPRLLHWLSIDTYEMLAGSWGINEFMFSGLIDGGFDRDQQDALLSYAERHATTRQYPHPRYRTMRDVYQLVLDVRTRIIPEYVEECVCRILGASPELVGFTCMFDQTIASVAVAKRLKERRPDLCIAFGGYALEGTPGDTVAKSFPWIDAVVVGDGEAAIVELAREATGVQVRDRQCDARVRIGKRVDLADSPPPDYDDWFVDVDELSAERSVTLRPKALPVETSRGCWWGQVKHCVFCGIDEETLKYRYKQPADALTMLEKLRERYGDYSFRFSDYILPKAYYTDLLPRLALVEPRFRLHCEIKANQTPERVRLMAEAGFFEVQPGIESFSTAVLRRMDKGVRAVDNVSLLKAGYVNAIIVDYNLLYGLPGDQPQEYEEMLGMVPNIYHLCPPVARTQTVITRFAPLQATPERFGLPIPMHHRCYDVLFSAEFLAEHEFDYDRYAYYFERSFQFGERLATLYSEVIMQVEHWKALHRERFVELSYTQEDSGAMHIVDSRFSTREEFELSPATSALYRLVDVRPVRVNVALRDWAATYGGCSDEALAALRELDSRRLLWRDGDSVLGVAIPREVSDGHRLSRWTGRWNAIHV